MRRGRRSAVAAVTAVAMGLVTAATAAPGPPPDRFIMSASGSTLNAASGGGQGALTWLHAPSTDLLVGVGGEYHTIDDAHWMLGSLSTSLSGGSPADRWTVTAAGRFGGGEIGARRFDYDTEAVRVSTTLSHTLSLQLETRQFDIDTSHGNLPKVGASLYVASHWLVEAAYARSAGGNLDTEFGGLRLDRFGPVSWFVGGVRGHVAPAVIDVQTGATGPAPRYWDGYAGVSKGFRAAQWTVSADYLALAGTRRMTLTVTCVLHPIT
ncbi:MAG TPA: hypothetical protein VFX20_14425 [Steroidobacteraceae bacterium]|nr:hypothetical protein [Steroidobacteraceae bacterium]